MQIREWEVRFTIGYNTGLGVFLFPMVDQYGIIVGPFSLIMRRNDEYEDDDVSIEDGVKA